MGEPLSPYVILGLQPGASRREVDEAYRRLIKQHHPDREGGDGQHVSDLNRAYAALKGGTGSAALSIAADGPRRARARRRRWPTLLFGNLAAGATALVLAWQPPIAETPKSNASPAGELPLDAKQQHTGTEVDRRAVASGVAEALRFARGEQWEEAAAYRTRCDSDLESFGSLSFGSLSLVEHCVAYDRALALLGRARNPSAEQRHFAVATRLTGSRVLAQSRIDLANRSAGLLLLQRQAEELR